MVKSGPTDRSITSRWCLGLADGSSTENTDGIEETAGASLEMWAALGVCNNPPGARGGAPAGVAGVPVPVVVVTLVPGAPVLLFV